MKSIIAEVAERRGWGSEDILTKPVKKKVPTCNCPAPTRNRLGGQQARIDLSQGIVRCASCMKPVAESCKRRDVVWLRSLLKLPPEQQDFESVMDMVLPD